MVYSRVKQEIRGELYQYLGTLDDASFFPFADAMNKLYGINYNSLVGIQQIGGYVD